MASKSEGRVIVCMQSFDGAEHTLRVGKTRPVTVEQACAQAHKEAALNIKRITDDKALTKVGAVIWR